MWRLMQKASLHVSKTSESTQNSFCLFVGFWSDVCKAYKSCLTSGLWRHTHFVWCQVCQDIYILFAVRSVKTYTFCLLSDLWRHTKHPARAQRERQRGGGAVLQEGRSHHRGGRPAWLGWRHPAESYSCGRCEFHCAVPLSVLVLGL